MTQSKRSCDDFMASLEGYVDDELSLSEALELERHLAGCPSCSTRLKNAQLIGQAMRSPGFGYEIPDDLRLKLRGFRGVASKDSRLGFGPALRWASVAAVVAISFGLGTRFSALRGSADSLESQAIFLHVRSLQVDHLLDVPSTDQHTVKPWFAGKIDFSPKVKDLKSQGFPLVGGRLDYLDGRAVAAVVFRRRGHVINVLTWPERADRPLQTRALDGFNLFQWVEGGMAYWVVSDLNSEELSRFVQLYRI